MRFKKPAATRVRYDYRCLHFHLQWESWQVNAKRAYRMYSEKNLRFKTKT